jgi:hypothetical protein
VPLMIILFWQTEPDNPVEKTFVMDGEGNIPTGKDTEEDPEGRGFDPMIKAQIILPGDMMAIVSVAGAMPMEIWLDASIRIRYEIRVFTRSSFSTANDKKSPTVFSRSTSPARLILCQIFRKIIDR